MTFLTFSVRATHATRVIALVLLSQSIFACSAMVWPDPSRLNADVRMPEAGPSDAALDSNARMDGTTSDSAVRDGANDTAIDVVFVSDASCATGCNDELACTRDVCENGRCVHTPDNGLCDDQNLCTRDVCDVNARMCTRTAVDADNDGAPALSVSGTTCVGGSDCNDNNANVRPSAAEICENNVDDNCDGQTDNCGAPDACSSARAIVLDSNPKMTTGTLEGLTSDFNFACNGNRGQRDALYYFDLPMGYDAIIDTAGSQTDVILGVAVGSTCPSNDIDFQVCNANQAIDRGLTQGRVVLRGVARSAGTRVYVAVKGETFATRGPFLLTITRVLTTTNACGNALDMSIGGAAYGVLEGSHQLTGEGSCVNTGAEAIFYLDNTITAANSRVYVRGNGTFAPDIYSRGTCANGTQLACDQHFAGVLRQITLPSSPPTLGYHVIVDDGRTGDNYIFVVDP